MTLDALEAAHREAIDSLKAGDIRRRARELATATAEPVPGWAAIRPRGRGGRKSKPPKRTPRPAPAGPRRPFDLNELRARFDSSHEDNARSAIRAHARRLARKLGVPMPEWALKRGDVPKRPAARGAIFVTMPDELRAWVARTPGAVARVSSTGVELHELGVPPRRFTSIEEATAAVAAK